MGRLTDLLNENNKDLGNVNKTDTPKREGIFEFLRGPLESLANIVPDDPLNVVTERLNPLGLKTKDGESDLVENVNKRLDDFFGKTETLDRRDGFLTNAGRFAGNTGKFFAKIGSQIAAESVANPGSLVEGAVAFLPSLAEQSIDLGAEGGNFLLNKLPGFGDRPNEPLDPNTIVHQLSELNPTDMTATANIKASEFKASHNMATIGQQQHRMATLGQAEEGLQPIIPDNEDLTDAQKRLFDTGGGEFLLALLPGAGKTLKGKARSFVPGTVESVVKQKKTLTPKADPFVTSKISNKLIADTKKSIKLEPKNKPTELQSVEVKPVEKVSTKQVLTTKPTIKGKVVTDEVIADTPLLKFDEKVKLPKTKDKKIDVEHKDIDKVSLSESTKQRPVEEYSLRNEDTDILTEMMGRDEISITEVRQFVRDKQAGKDFTGKELDIATELNKGEEAPTAPQIFALAKRRNEVKAEILKLDAEINKFTGDGSFTKSEGLRLKREILQKEFDAINEAGKKSGVVQSDAFRARQALKSGTFTSVEAKAQAKKNKGKDLTELENENIDLAFKEIEALKKDLLLKEKENIQLKIDRDSKLAESVVNNKTVITISKNKNKTRRQKAVQDRADIKKQIMSKTGLEVLDFTGVPKAGSEGLFLIGKLAMTYIESGALELVKPKDMLREVTKLVKKDIPSLTEAEIHQAIGTKDPKLVKKQVTEVQKQQAIVKKHAKMLTEINDKVNGLAGKKKNKRVITDAEVESIFKTIRNVRNTLQESGLDAKSIERAEATLNKIADQVENNYRPVKKKKLITNEGLKKKKAEIDDLSGKLKVIDDIANLIEEIRLAEKGIFTEKNPTKRKEIHRDVARLKVRLKELQPKKVRIKNIFAKRDAMAARLTSLRAQYRGDFRTLRKQKEPLTGELKDIQANIDNVIGLINSKDRLIDLETQMITGKFTVLEPKTPKFVSPELRRAQTKVRIAEKEARSQVEAMKVHTGFGKITHGAKELANTMRTLKATADMSYLLRQGLVASVSRPKLAGEAFKKAFQGAFSKFKAEEIAEAIKRTDEYLIGQEHGLHISEIGNKFALGEEMFLSSWAEKIPGYGKIVRASERHMITGLNVLRQGAFNEFLTKNPNATSAQLKIMANWINVTTGRGNLPGKLSASADGLSQIFFAPRFAASRLETPFYFFRPSVFKDPILRKAVAKDMASFTALVGTSLGLAHMSGLDIGVDPRDADFLKIRTGDTRISLDAGLGSSFRFLARVGLSVSDNNGLRPNDILKSESEADVIEATKNFLKYKITPSLSAAYELAYNKDLVNQPTGEIANKVSEFVTGSKFRNEKVAGAVETIGSIPLPLVLESLIEAFINEGAQAALLAGGSDFFGAAAQNYSNSEKKVRTRIRLAMDANKPELAEKIRIESNENNDFYIGPNVKNTTEQKKSSEETSIKAKIVAGDIEGAKNQYNVMVEEFGKKKVRAWEFLKSQAENTLKERRIQENNFKNKNKRGKK